jgi:hypothetical protein
VRRLSVLVTIRNIVAMLGGRRVGVARRTHLGPVSASGRGSRDGQVAKRQAEKKRHETPLCHAGVV